MPDEQSWTVWGTDPLVAGLHPVLDAGGAAAVLVPERIPDALAAPLDALLRAVPSGARTEILPVPVLDGSPARLRPQASESREPSGEQHEHDDEHEGHEGHEGHGHMMAITGDPSADGLVMESIDFSLGPLLSPLPGGLLVEVALDGDVVAECRVRATLRQPRSAAAVPRPPDGLSPVTWAAAIAAADTDGDSGGWLRVARVELERAVSHAAWLRALGRLLGWPMLVDAASAVLAPLVAAGGHISGESAAGADAPAVLDAAADHAVRVRKLAHGRRLAGRMARRGVVSDQTAIDRGLAGPVARASGIAEDARAEDPLYRELGFAVVVRREGDARARTLVRVEELVASIGLARAALERARLQVGRPAPAASAAGVTLEGPRGLVHAQRTPSGWQLAAPGQQAALTAAGDAAVGLEWAAALVALASFDLSPWQVGP